MGFQYSPPSLDFLESQLIPAVAYLDYWISSRSNGFQSTTKSGKWCIFVSRKRVNEDWVKVNKAVLDGRLTHAKVSTAKRPGKHVICVYTKIWTDFDETLDALKVLRSLSFDKKLVYKRDFDTMNDINRFAMQSPRGTDINFYRGYGAKFIAETENAGRPWL